MNKFKPAFWVISTWREERRIMAARMEMRMTKRANSREPTADAQPGDVSAWFSWCLKLAHGAHAGPEFRLHISTFSFSYSRPRRGIVRQGQAAEGRREGSLYKLDENAETMPPSVRLKGQKHWTALHVARTIYFSLRSPTTVRGVETIA